MSCDGCLVRPTRASQAKFHLAHNPQEGLIGLWPRIEMDLHFFWESPVSVCMHCFSLFPFKEHISSGHMVKIHNKIFMKNSNKKWLAR
jgi:hypothetical protein